MSPWLYLFNTPYLCIRTYYLPAQCARWVFPTRVCEAKREFSVFISSNISLDDGREVIDGLNFDMGLRSNVRCKIYKRICRTKVRLEIYVAKTPSLGYL